MEQYVGVNEVGAVPQSPPQSGVPTEAGLLRAAALNLGFGAVPQHPPQKQAVGPRIELRVHIRDVTLT